MNKKISTTSSSEFHDWLARQFGDRSTTFRKNTKSVPEVVHHQYLKEIDTENNFFEHTLTFEQLRDLFPLSRICIEDPLSTKGLNKEEVAIRIATDGRNVINPVTRQAAIRTFLNQFLNTFRMLLLVAALACFVIYSLDSSRKLELGLAITLIVVFFILCIVSYWQERRIFKQVNGFQSILPTSCVIVRSGRKARVNTDDIVVGDIVCLNPGSRVPADLRLIYTDELQLETSWITGEVEPLEFYSRTVNKNISVFDSQNIAFNGCMCIHGKGLGVAIRCGNNSIMGRLMKSISKEKGRPTRLNLEHQSFVRFIYIFSISMGLITFLFGLIMTNFQRIVSAFINGFLVILVANVPQGLPITLGAALIIIARRLSKMNFHMKRLDIADTLGTANILMCDKTGIFTSNNITVTCTWCGLEYYNQGQRTESDEESHLISNRSDFSSMLTVMSICNKAHIQAIGSGNVKKWRSLSVQYKEFTKLYGTITPDSETTDNDYQLTYTTFTNQPRPDLEAALLYKSITGQPTDVALLKFVEKVASAQSIRRKYDILMEIPFNGQRRFQIVVARQKNDYDLEDEKLLMFIKGAPEELIQQCNKIIIGEERIDLNEEHHDLFSKAYMKFGADGCSCIAFAMGEVDSLLGLDEICSWNDLYQHDLCFIGMAAMYDPPKEDVFKSISNLWKAGIKCFMVTGDHSSTALAVAKQIGFIDENSPKANGDMDSVSNESVIHGEVLDTLTSDQWDNIFSKQSVIFARTTPAQKMIIIKECQKRKQVVAVTGDGILDAPALKRADVGIAIESAGGVVAKEAADIVLIDSDIKTIEKGIKEGRLLYGNLKKTIAYTLSHLLPEFYAVFLSFTLGFPLGLTSLQVLTIDLITELPPSIAMTFEPAERDIMQIKPRKPNSKLVSRSLLIYSYVIAGNIISVGCILAYFSIFWMYHISISDLVFSNDKYWRLGSSNFTSSSGYTYTSPMQIKIYQQATTAWHITLVMSQVFHFWTCTTRRTSLFRHGFHNIHAVFSVLLEVLLLNLLIYIPGINTLLGITRPPTVIWLFSFAVGIVLFTYNEGRKYAIRRYPNNRTLDFLKW